MRRYGQLPAVIGSHEIVCSEMMFYQYLPIKLDDTVVLVYEQRLNCFSKLIDEIAIDFVKKFGFQAYKKHYIYLTAKHLYQSEDCSFNRKGYHSDGFLTDDINYIWYNNSPTIFNYTEFNLTNNDCISMGEMEEQALECNEKMYQNNSLLRLDQYNIHKVGPQKTGMRTFLKISFSKDKYNLEGNSRNYLLPYEWKMKPRKTERNIPQQ